MEEKPMRIEIEQSPYGDTGAVYHGQLGMMKHYILQLKSFRNQKKTPDERRHMEADIRGYEEIVASGSEDNAIQFMRLKHDARMAGKPYKNNEKVIEHLKEKGIWKNGLR